MKIIKESIKEPVQESIKDNLVEATLADLASDKMTDELVDDSKGKVIYDYDDIFDYLDSIYKANIRQMRNKGEADIQPLNVLLMGVGGTSKSGVVKTWINKNNLTLVKYSGSQLDTDQVKGAPSVSQDEEGNKRFDLVPSSAWDNLNIPGKKSVLFIDELNRSYTDCRASILDIVQSHEITAINPEGSNTKFLNNFVMTIACCNPPDKNHRGADALDDAMTSRFAIFKMVPNIKFNTNYWLKETEKNMAQAKLNLAAGKDNYFGDDYTKEDYDEDMKVYDGTMKIIKGIRKSKITYDSDDVISYKLGNGDNVLNSRSLWSAIKQADGNPSVFLQYALPRQCGVYEKSGSGSSDADAGVISAINNTFNKLKLAVTAEFKKSEDKAGVENAWIDSSKNYYDRIEAYIEEFF